MYLVSNILDVDQTRLLTYFTNLELCSENIANIWEMCNVSLKNICYEGRLVLKSGTR